MTADMGALSPAGLYIHIPFCVRKCAYCDFLSFADVPLAVQLRYLDALRAEIHEAAARCARLGLRFDTVFVGGGTPSCVPPAALAGVLRTALDVLPFVPDTPPEITVEVNPGTVTPEHLEMYRACGVNRISVGVQALRGRLLRTLGRIHGVSAAVDTVRLLRAHGFTNCNLDLMIGIPGLRAGTVPGLEAQDPQTVSEALDAVRFAIRTEIPHISLYSLITEPDTPLFAWTEAGRTVPCDEDDERRMYREACLLLEEAGYCHYEISNFAKPGFVCRHNVKYWQCAPYLGVGLGSASYLPAACRPVPRAYGNGDGDRDEDRDTYLRITNPRDLQAYLTGGAPVDVERIRKTECQNEFMMLGFRMLSGPDPALYRARFGSDLTHDYADTLDTLRTKGLIRSDLSLTGHGLDFANEIFRAFV